MMTSWHVRRITVCLRMEQVRVLTALSSTAIRLTGTTSFKAEDIPQIRRRMAFER